MAVEEEKPPSFFKIRTISPLLILFGLMGAALGLYLTKGGVMSRMDEGDFHFDLGNGRCLDIYCEGAFFYDPPGYVYYGIKQNGKVLVPKHRFCSIGPERVPSGRVDMVSTEDGDTIAIRRNFDVIILHDFKTNRTWPPEYGEFKLEDFLLARELLERFKKEGQERMVLSSSSLCVRWSMTETNIL